MTPALTNIKAPGSPTFLIHFNSFCQQQTYLKLLQTISIMKFLQAVVLSAICVGYVTASFLGYFGHLSLHRAIDEGNLDIAVDLVKQDESLGEAGVKYVIRKDNHDPDLIANFVIQTNQANANTLDELGVHSPIETFENVLERVDFPQQALVDSAASYDVTSRTDKFLVLLNKIVKPEDQEKVVEKGIEQLVDRYTDTSPLLNALKGKTFRSERLEYLATQKAFMEGAKSGRVNILQKDICNHAAITPKLYADALIATAEKGEYSLHLSLLKQADQYDLQVVKEKAGYADLKPKFRNTIEKALKTAAPEGTRTRTYDIQTVEKAEETFKELRHDGITTEIADLIDAYVTVYAPTRRIAQLAVKKVASDVTGISTKIEGSGDIGSERVGYVTASHPGYAGYLVLCQAIDEGRLDIALELGKQDETLVEDGVRYVIGKDDPDLIANFLNQTNQANAHTLMYLWHESSIETFGKVLEKVDFPQQVLIDVASDYNVASKTEKFLVFLNKIVKPEDQEKAVEKSIERLVGMPDVISPLLNALKGQTFRSERLEYFAIQKVFMAGAKRGSVYHLPEDICEHAAITPELYADALIVTVKWWLYSGMRIFLLKRADRYDLEAVKEEECYADLEPEFRDEIEKALKTAAPGGTRTRTYDIQTVKKAEEVFDELGHPGISEDVFNIIADSVAFDAPARREGQIAPKKATKKVASDVTSIPTKIKGSGDIGSERVRED